MSPVPVSDASDRVAYAIGVGLVSVALVGIPVRFAFQGLPTVLVYGGSFLLGLLAGFLLAPRARGNRRE